MAFRFLILIIIALVAIFFIPPKILFAQVVINEVFTDPSGNDKGLEWIELYNSSSLPVDLTNWQIGAGKYFILPSFSILPDSFLIVRWRADGQNTTNEIFTGTQTIDTNIGNSSGFVALFKAIERNKNTIVDYLEYGKAGQTWESAASDAGIWTKGQFLPIAAEGQSLGLKQDGWDKNLSGDWQMFSAATPGQPNGTIVNTARQEISQQQNNASATPPSDLASLSPSAFSNYSDEILINEFMPWPRSAGQSPVLAGWPQDGKEWVELINTGTEIIDLSGWQIDDAEGAGPPQKISTGTLIKPDQFLVIELEKNTLNNDGDQIRLIWPDEQLLHSISYKSSKQNFSSSRFENGLWLWTDQPTPGQENKKSAQKYSPSHQTENPNLQNAPPLIAAISEAVSQEKNENNSREKNIVAVTDTNTAKEQVSPQHQTAASQSFAAQKITAKNSGFNPLLALAAIGVLSSLSGIGIVYFKRKKTIDSRQKPS